MSIATELTKLSNTKLDIKHAIQDKGVIVHDEDTFDTYANKIENIAGYGENIDISKTDYSIGNGGYPTVVEEGRLFHPIYYANTNVVIRPMDSSGNWLDVDWTKDFEIFITFQVTSLSSQLSLFTNGILNTSYEYSPTIFLSNNNLRVLLCGGGSSWDLNYDTNFTPTINTWYALSMKYTALTNVMTVDISTDFENWTNLMTQVLTFTIQHDAASLIFGGRGYEPQNWNPGNLIIDTFNTYIKDDTGEIVWGAFAGRFGNGEFPISSTDSLNPFDKFSIDAKLKYSYSTGSGGSQQTYTYTFDEDGFYLCYISTWGNAGQTSSITYSGTYTEYFTKDCSGKMRMSVVYVTAGTVVTMYLSSAYWMYNAVAIKLKGFNHIGNELFSNVSASSENISFSNLSSSKTMVCTYFIDSDNGNISIETYPKTYEISYTNFNQIIVWDGIVMPAGSWPARLGIIFFNSDSNLGGIIKRCAGQVGAIFHVFEVS